MGPRRKSLVKKINGRHRVATRQEERLLNIIASHECTVRELAGKMSVLQRRIARAHEEGAEMFMREKHLPEAIKYLTRDLAHALGPRLAPFAEQLLSSEDRRRVPRRRLELRADLSSPPALEHRVAFIEGVIPDFHFKIPVRS